MLSTTTSLSLSQDAQETIQKRLDTIERRLTAMQTAPCFVPQITSRTQMIAMLGKYKNGEMAIGEIMANLDLWCERYARAQVDYWRSK